ncbi:MAG: hypothetical protein J5I65_07555 [Aridibacter famidurans]|nr:hypothetical protein [Aridibacter famidurans]
MISFRKIFRSLLFPVVLLACGPFSGLSPLFAQSEIDLHQWSSLTLFNGLPSNSVRVIAQTDDGVMWFGTDGGLARLDARGIQKVPLGEFEGPVRLLCTAGNDLIGVTETASFVLREGKVEAAEGLQGLSVRSLKLGRRGVAAATDNGIYSANTKDLRFHRVSFPDEGDRDYTAFGEMPDGQVLFGTSGNGIRRFRRGEWVVAGASPYFINVIESDVSGRTWIGADTGNRSGGLYFYEGGRVEQAGGSSVGTVTSIALGVSGDRLWAGTEIAGLFLFEGRTPVENYTFASTGGGLRSNRIYDVFVDRENTVWVGGDRGVSRFDPASPDNVVLSEESPANFVRLIFAGSEGLLYAGTNRGLFVLDEGTWRTVPGFTDDTVYSLALASDGGLLVGTRSSLRTADGTDLIEGDIRGIGLQGGKIYAAVFRRGLVRFVEEEEELVFPHEELTCVWSDGNAFLFGTGKGEIYRLEGGKAERVPGFEQIEGIPVWNLRPSGGPSDPLAIATQSGVFVRRGDSLEHHLEGVPVRDVSILEGGIWAASIGNGLIHIRNDDRFGVVRSTISTEQGLLSDSVFGVRPLDDGRLLVATTSGLSFYRPNDKKPLIAAVRLLGQRLHSDAEMKAGVSLDYPQNSLLLEVGGLSSRTVPERFQYAFLLIDSKGNEVKRQVTGEPRFAMEDLDAGSYTVEAYAFNQDLVRSDPLKFGFSVAEAPFPWTSAALGLLLFIALIALVWVIIERHRITAVNRKLTEARLDLANEAERERRRIARDLHDQTLADLRNLMLRSDKISGGDSEFRGEIEGISEEIRRICEDLSPSVFENVGLFASLEFLLSGSGLKTEFKVRKGSDEDLRFPPADQIQVFRIAQEVISNIVRHAEARTVEMRVSADEASGFALEIEDDGTAEFDHEKAGKEGMGLSNIKSRASLIGADVSWERKPAGGGYVFALHKPVA